MSHQTTAKIGVATATIIGMNAMIGAGIFAVPAVLASSVGPAGFVTYAFSIAAVWFMAHSLARVARMFPEEGSFYNYTKQWAGHGWGLIAAGSYLVGLLIAMGLLAQFAGFYLHQSPFTETSAYALGLITLAILTILNIVGVKFSELGQRILICSTVLPLVIITIMCLTKINLNNLVPFAPYGYTNIFRATKAAMFGLFGFECAASLFSIVRDPEHNVPRALTYSITLVGIIYFFFVGSIILSIPLSNFVDVHIPISQVLRQIFPQQQWVLAVIHISILSAIIGTIHSMIWTSSNLLISLAKIIRSGFVPHLISRNILTSRTSVLMVGICIFSSYVLLKNVDLFFSLTALFIVFTYAMSIATLLTIKSEWNSRRNFQTIIGLITAGIIFFFAFEGLIAALQ